MKCWPLVCLSNRRNLFVCILSPLSVFHLISLQNSGFLEPFLYVSWMCWSIFLNVVVDFSRDLPTVLSPATGGQESHCDLRSAVAQVTSEEPKERLTMGPLCACRGPTLGRRLQPCRLFQCCSQVVRSCLNSSLMRLGLGDWISTSLSLFLLFPPLSIYSDCLAPLLIPSCRPVRHQVKGHRVRTRWEQLTLQSQEFKQSLLWILEAGQQGQLGADCLHLSFLLL